MNLKLENLRYLQQLEPNILFVYLLLSIYQWVLVILFILNDVSKSFESFLNVFFSFQYSRYELNCPDLKFSENKYKQNYSMN